MENRLLLRPQDSLDSIAEALQEGGAIAALTNIGIANHFVVAYELRNGLVRVADPLFGMRWDSVRSFDQRALPIFIKVKRKYENVE